MNISTLAAMISLMMSDSAVASFCVTVTLHEAETFELSVAMAMMTAVPLASAVSFPLLSTLTMDGLLDLHETVL